MTAVAGLKMEEPHEKEYAWPQFAKRVSTADNQQRKLDLRPRATRLWILSTT